MVNQYGVKRVHYGRSWLDPLITRLSCDIHVRYTITQIPDSRYAQGHPSRSKLDYKNGIIRYYISYIYMYDVSSNSIQSEPHICSYVLIDVHYFISSHPYI